MIIKNAVIHDGLGNVFRKDVRIMEGHIAELGQKLVGEEVLDADGAHLLPGFIDPLTSWGINGSSTEVKVSSEDNEELSDPVTPWLETFYAVNGRALSVQQLPAYGITSVGIAPASTNVFGGQISVFYTDGTDPLQMCLRRNAGMMASVSDSVKNTYRSQGRAPMTKMNICYLFADALQRASLENREKIGKGAEQDKRKLSALSCVLDGTTPLFLACDDADDRERVHELLAPWPKVRMVFCRENNYRPEEKLLSLPGRTVIYGYDGLNFYPDSVPADADAVRKLWEQGTRFLVSAAGRGSYGRENYLWAAMHLMRGIRDSEEVLKMMTSAPAALLGIAGKTGSISTGKNADLVLWSQNPLETYQAKVLCTWIQGKAVYQEGDVRRCYY